MTKPGAIARTILFSGHDLKFIRAFVDHCARDARYRVLVDEHPGHQITDHDKCLELLPHADVIFCEWCLGNAQWYSHRKRQGQRLIIRLHHQEMELSYRHELAWDNVEAIIFTNFPHYHRFCSEQPQHRGKAMVIFCDVDCDALDQEKLPGAEFNLGLVGMNPMRKRPDLAFEILAKLRQSDSRYTLFFKSRMPWEYHWLWNRAHEREYYGHFLARVEASPHRNSVVFDAHGDDMASWYCKVGFILSTSDHEGSHQAVAEGMAAGSIPIIRSWNGATPLYPSKFVFSSVDDAVGLIREFRRSQFYELVAAEAKAYAREHFNPRRIHDRIEALFSPEGARSCSSAALDVRVAPPAGASPPVLILGYLPAGFRGGYRIRIEQEIKMLSKHGCRVHLACLHPGNLSDTALAAHRAELEGLGCTVHLVPIANFFDIQLPLSSIRELLDGLQRIADTHGLHLLHAEALYCARLGLLLRERCPQVRLVFDCHGTTPEEERLSGAHPSRITTMQDWERRTLAEADLNVFVSEAMNHFYLKEYGFSGLPHIVVPCCVADERFPDANLPPTLPVPANRPVLAYVGTMAAWQCGEEMIHLFAQVQHQAPDAFFLLLIPQTDHEKARDRILKYRLPEESILLAELPHDQVAATLQRAHAGLLLRRTHPVNQVSSPTKFGEYLAAGLPVIMTDGIGDFSGMATRERVGLLLEPALLGRDQLPSEEILRIVGFVRESVKQRRQVSARCRCVAREHLHWDTASTALLNAYRAVLANVQDDVCCLRPT